MNKMSYEQLDRWANFLANYLDENYDSSGSDTAWDRFVDQEHNDLPMEGCECVLCLGCQPHSNS